MHQATSSLNYVVDDFAYLILFLSLFVLISLSLLLSLYLCHYLYLCLYLCISVPVSAFLSPSLALFRLSSSNLHDVDCLDLPLPVSCT